jgi:tRNA modification GTPase
MYVEDTIVALATPPGRGAVAIIRLSGPRAFEILHSIWRPVAGRLEPRRLQLGDVVDPETRACVDRAMAVIFRRPHSLTGEDVAELQCHGGTYLVRRICGMAMRSGARMAERGEFTRRAFLNGRIDLTEAEAIDDLVQARGEGAMRLAIEQLHGSLAHKVQGLRRALIAIRGHLEAEIDFSDEGLNLPSRDDIATAIARLSADVAILHDSYQRGRLMREGVRVAIVGKPNVGKSSILNCLLGRERAIVTAIPGTTRDTIEDTIQLGPYSLILEDTAGIRSSLDEVEKIGIERSRGAIAGADLVLAVFDSAQKFTDEDVAIAHHVRGRAGLVLLNKNDLPPQMSVLDLRGAGIELAHASISALKGDGLDNLKVELIRLIDELAAQPKSVEIAITRERHREALARALDALAAARQSADASMPPEIVAVDVSLASDTLGEITGEVHIEDVLDAVFREFCIGK